MSAKPERYYLAGKMSGLPNFGYDRFTEAAENLRSLGLLIVSPHEIDFGETEETRGTQPYKVYLAKGLVQLMRCDNIVLLPGWNDSTGARLELTAALTSGMGVYYYLDSSPWIMSIG